MFILWMCSKCDGELGKEDLESVSILPQFFSKLLYHCPPRLLHLVL